MKKKVYVITREMELASCYDYLGTYYIEKDTTVAVFDELEKAKAYLAKIDVSKYVQYKPKANETRTDMEIKLANGVGDIYWWVIKEMEVQ